MSLQCQDLCESVVLGETYQQHLDAGIQLINNSIEGHLKTNDFEFLNRLYNNPILNGEVHDAKAAPDLIKILPVSDYTIADKGYDSEEIREQIKHTSSIPRGC